LIEWIGVRRRGIRPATRTIPAAGNYRIMAAATLVTAETLLDAPCSGDDPRPGCFEPSPLVNLLQLEPVSGGGGLVVNLVP
jgi:hypothetical protein